MDATEQFQNFPRWTHAALLYILKPLPDSLSFVGLRGNVEEALIGLGILDDGFRFAIHGENQRPLGLLEALHEFRRITPESCHRLNVLLDVEHIRSVSE
jgi:hypothetical protein